MALKDIWNKLKTQNAATDIVSAKQNDIASLASDAFPRFKTRQRTIGGL